MYSEKDVVAMVYAAKESRDKADELIRYYTPFIRSEASKCTYKAVTDKDDEFSVAMLAFYEAIKGYDKSRGSFISYASLTIKSRIYDYNRREIKHSGNISLNEDGDDDRSLADELHDGKDAYSESENLEATKAEIKELGRVMAGFGIGFSDVAENSPKQDRTYSACARAVRLASRDKELLDEMLRTKKLPMAKLVELSGVERKTLERHRKYLLAMLIIQTNGYVIVRDHIYRMLKGREAV